MSRELPYVYFSIRYNRNEKEGVELDQKICSLRLSMFASFLLIRNKNLKVHEKNSSVPPWLSVNLCFRSAFAGIKMYYALF